MPDSPSSIQYVFWDWYGVLGLKGLWHKSSKTNPEIARFVTYAFADKNRFRRWMRGQLSIDTLVQESGARLHTTELVQYMAEDWESDDIFNTELYTNIRHRYPQADHYIITDNVDIFGEYARTNRLMAQYFKGIFNSADLGCLKSDSPGLFEAARQSLGLTTYQGCLLLDDRTVNCERFESLGGQTQLILEGIDESSSGL